MSDASQESKTTGTVLLIEDDDVLRVAVLKILQTQRFHVIEASDGRIALDLFQAHLGAIDVVMLDMHLPDSSGTDVLRQLRRVHPAVKVILTSTSSLDSLAVGGEPQPWAFIRKPYQLKKLATLLREACRHGKK